MTTKRTHGPCTCMRDGVGAVCHMGPNDTVVSGHAPNCPSLYPAEQEPDALTRLVRMVRSEAPFHRDEWTEQTLALISEAREEQGKARNDGLRLAARVAREVAGKANGYPERQKVALDIAVIILEQKDAEP